MARAVCETVRVLESLAGCCTLGIVISAIGKGLQVKSGANRVTHGNIYVFASAESDSGKKKHFGIMQTRSCNSRRSAREIGKMKPSLDCWPTENFGRGNAKLKKSVGNKDSSRDREEIRVELKEKLAALDSVETKLRTPALSCEDVTGEKLAI